MRNASLTRRQLPAACLTGQVTTSTPRRLHASRACFLLA